MVDFLKNASKLIFSERSFVEAELRHTERMRKAGEAYQSAEDFRDEAQLRVKAKRQRLGWSFIFLAGLILAGATLAIFVSKLAALSLIEIRIIRGLSLLIFGWAIFGKLGDIETFKGQTLIELTSAQLYKTTYSIGIFMTAFVLFVEPSTS